MGAIKEKGDKSQVFTTWFLYFLLDFITMLSSNKLNGSYVILFGFAIGSLIMAVILLYQGRIAWTWLETVVTTLVLICISTWCCIGPYGALIFGIISESIVGIYLVIKTFINPTIKYNLTGYILFLIASIIAIFNAEDWSIAQMGYPLCETILCILTIIPLLKKYGINNK